MRYLNFYLRLFEEIEELDYLTLYEKNHKNLGTWDSYINFQKYLIFKYSSNSKWVTTEFAIHHG